MLKCWDPDPEDRPSFTMIASTISKALQIIAGYLDMSRSAADTAEVSAMQDGIRQPLLVKISLCF